ncbi:MAG: hypothetical protein BIFFINMI_02412 [Phycisphaerae bacterium]|nr:hypothetical protein [Phycisphaerae bacterium]
MLRTGKIISLIYRGLLVAGVAAVLLSALAAKFLPGSGDAGSRDALRLTLWIAGISLLLGAIEAVRAGFFAKK